TLSCGRFFTASLAFTTKTSPDWSPLSVTSRLARSIFCTVAVRVTCCSSYTPETGSLERPNIEQPASQPRARAQNDRARAGERMGILLARAYQVAAIKRVRARDEEAACAYVAASQRPSCAPVRTRDSRVRGRE